MEKESLVHSIFQSKNRDKNHGIEHGKGINIVYKDRDQKGLHGTTSGQSLTGSVAKLTGSPSSEVLGKGRGQKGLHGTESGQNLTGSVAKITGTPSSEALTKPAKSHKGRGHKGLHGTESGQNLAGSVVKITGTPSTKAFTSPVKALTASPSLTNALAKVGLASSRTGPESNDSASAEANELMLKQKLQMQELHDHHHRSHTCLKCILLWGVITCCICCFLIIFGPTVGFYFFYEMFTGNRTASISKINHTESKKAETLSYHLHGPRMGHDNYG